MERRNNVEEQITEDGVNPDRELRPQDQDGLLPFSVDKEKTKYKLKHPIKHLFLQRDFTGTLEFPSLCSELCDKLIIRTLSVSLRLFVSLKTVLVARRKERTAGYLNLYASRLWPAGISVWKDRQYGGMERMRERQSQRESEGKKRERIIEKLRKMKTREREFVFV